MTETPTVFQAFSAVMESVSAIGKNERNTQQNYAFRGVDSTVNAVGPALRTHGVVIVPRALSIESERYPTKSGGNMRNATVHMEYTVYGPAGDSFTGSTYGEAADAGDKAVSKAQSVAYRTFLLEALTIPTNERDPDMDTHERAATRPRTAPNGQPSPADQARADLRTLLNDKGYDLTEAVDLFHAKGYGELKSTSNVKAIRGLIEHYRKVAGDA